MRSPLWSRWTLTIVLALILQQFVSPVVALICDFHDEGCLDPLAQVSVPVAFRPIFPKPIRFFYGFDAQAVAGSGPMIKVSFWLQYDRESVIRHAVQSNSTTEIALRIGNLTGFRGGKNHGCDGVWGHQCSQNLKEYLRKSIYKLAKSGVSYTNPLETVLQQMSESQSPPTIPSCPESLFQVDVIPVKTFVQEDELQQKITVDYPGNTAFPWRTWYIPNTTPPQQAVQVAVGIISRGPSWGSAPLSSPDEVQIELVCARAPREQRPGDYEDPDGGDDEDCYPPV